MKTLAGRVPAPPASSSPPRPAARRRRSRRARPGPRLRRAAQLSAAERDNYRAVFAALRAQRLGRRRRPARRHARRAAARRRPRDALHHAGLAPGRARAARSICSPARPICRRPATSPGSPARAAPRACPICPTPGASYGLPGQPRRARAAHRSAAMRSPTRSSRLIQPLIRDDKPVEAEALLETRSAELSDEARTAFRQRIAWVYFLNGNDARGAADRRTRPHAARPNMRSTPNGWPASPPGGWAITRRPPSISTIVASRSTDVELAAAGHYWAARADTAGGRPERVQARLRDRRPAWARPSTACSRRARSA